MSEIVSLMDGGTVDLALTYRRSLQADRDFVPLFRARPYALLSCDHPFAEGADVALADLADLPMVVLGLPFAVEYYTGIFTERGLTPKVVHSSKTSEMARALVASGFGFSVLNICDPGNVEERSGYCCRPIRDEVDAPYFGIALAAGSRRPALTERFIDMCTEMAAARAFDPMTVFPAGYPQKTVEDAL